MTTAVSTKVLSKESRRNFLEKPPSSLVALCCFFVFIVIVLIMPPRSNSRGYFAALKDKHRLLRSTISPKIIFVGGSNLAFGLNSSAVQAKFHRPVVNMGLCASFGLRYLLEEVKDDIHAGDIIVLVPEYGMLQNSVDGGPDLIHAVEVYPPAAIAIFKAYTNSCSAFFELLKLIVEIPAAKCNAFCRLLSQVWQNGRLNRSVFENWETDDKIASVARFYFDKHGDYFAHFGKANQNFIPAWGLIRDINSEAVSLINDFCHYADQRRAKVVLIPAPICREHLINSYRSMESLSQWPNQKKLIVTVIASPQRYTFPSSYFYQLYYHLNLVGRDLRTRLITEDLSRQIIKAENSQ